MSREDRLKRCIEDLHSTDAEVVWSSVARLRRSGSDLAFQLLINSLDDAEIIDPVVSALNRKGWILRALPKLILLLQSEDRRSVFHIMEALAGTRDLSIVEPFIALLDDSDDMVVDSVARRLADIGDPRAVQPLMRTMGRTDIDPCDRERIWYALGRIASDAELEEVAHLLDEPNWTTCPEDRLNLLPPPLKSYRRLPRVEVDKIKADIAKLGSADEDEAFRAEARLGRRRGQVIEFLVEATASPKSNVRHRALHALERVGDVRACPVILDMADDPKMDNRWCAYEILGKLWKERAIPILIDVLRNVDADSAELHGAVKGLAAIGSAAIPALSDMIETGDSELRQRASWALRDIPEEAVIEPLSTLLSDPDPVTRWTGIESLSLLGQENPQSFGRRCLALIEPFVNDPAGDVREVAVSELGELSRAMGECR